MGKWSLLLISWGAPVKVRYQSLKFDCKCYITPFFSCLVTIWLCEVVFSQCIFLPCKRNSKVYVFTMFTWRYFRQDKKTVYELYINVTSVMDHTQRPLIYSHPCTCCWFRVALSICGMDVRWFAHSHSLPAGQV